MSYTDYTDLLTILAQRDDSDEQCDPALVDRLFPHGREWAYWQGYVEALCDTNGIDVTVVEAAYQGVQDWASESMDATAESAAMREP